MRGKEELDDPIVVVSPAWSLFAYVVTVVTMDLASG